MTKERYKTGEAPVIHIDSCGGDLVVRGRAESILQIRGEYQIEESQKGYRLSTNDSLNLTVPVDAILSIGQVGGDFNIKHFTGHCSCEHVHGDAVLSNVGDIELGIIYGDLVARHSVGTLSVTEVNGDVSARDIHESVFEAVHGDVSARVVNGNLIIRSNNGDADLRVVTGDVMVEQSFRDVNLAGISGKVSVSGVTGDIRLRGGLESGDHSLDAQGDVVIRWPKGMPLNLNAIANHFDNRLQLEDVVEKNGSLSGRIGEGDTNLSVTSAARLILRQAESTDNQWGQYESEMEFDFGVEMAGIAARFEAEVNNHISRVTRDLESKFGPDFGQRINEKVVRKAEKAAERARRRAESRGRMTGFDFASPPAEPSKKQVSMEEQLKILKMVETGKISPEEAGMLLEALEG